MASILSGILGIFVESSGYLLLGFLVAGLLHVILARFPGITASLKGNGPRPVFTSALVGLPMPLCSCSVLPAAMTLRRQGAGRGPVGAFLISVPETDVVSILLTLSMLGGTMAIFRPAAALATAVAAGLFISLSERRNALAHTAPAPATTDCCHPRKTESETTTGTRSGPWWKRALHYGFVQIFDDIIAQLFLGILVAGVLMALLPDVNALASSQGALWTYLLMLVIGAPLYVCAVASTPVAAGLIAGGLSPGAALVFLLAGPATNIASLFVLRSEFGARLLAVYLGAIAIGSLAAGWAFDFFLGHSVTAADIMRKHHDHGAGAPAIAATVVFLALVVVSFYRTRLLPRLFARLSGRSSEQTSH